MNSHDPQAILGMYVGQVPGRPGNCLAPGNNMNIYLNMTMKEVWDEIVASMEGLNFGK